MANELDILNNSGSYTPQSQIARRRLAEAMLKDSMDPVKGNGGNVSWTQGLAKMAQAMLGGYDMYKLDQEDKDGQKKLADFQAGSMGLPTSPSPAQGTGTAPASTPGAAPVSSAPADKLKFGRQVAEFYIEQGFTPTQAAAIAGNMVAESGGRTDTVYSGRDGRGDNPRNSPMAPHSIGIAQWNDRSRALIDYARKQGIDIPEGDLRDRNYAQEVIRRIPLETQLGFSVQELNGPEARAAAMLKATPDDLRMATRGAISYHRPAGWTPSNPEGGHNFNGRYGLAALLLKDLQSNPYKGKQALPAQFVPEDQNDPAVQPQPLAPAGVVPPAPAPQVPPAAPNPSPAPVSAANLPVATPNAPPAPISGGPQVQAPPAPNLTPPAQQPAYRGDLNEQTWAALGPRAAAVAEGVRSSDPRVRAAATQEFQATQQKIQASMAPSDFKGRQDSEFKQTQIDENRAEFPKKLADARKANAEAAKAELEASTLRTPQQIYGRALNALSEARKLPEIYGDFAFGRALGPAVGANLSGVDDKSWNINPVQFIGKQIGDAGNYMSALTEGGASPAEVQSLVGGLQSELGQMIRKSQGMSAREGDSNVELQNFLKMVGNLGTATSKEDFYRRLDDVNARFARLTGQEKIDIPRVEVKPEQMVERAVPLQEQGINLIKRLVAERGPVPPSPAPQQQPPVDDGLTPLQRAMLMGRNR